MKQITKYILALILGATTLVSCEINDPIGDIARTGDIAANIYMVIPSSIVDAGNPVDFHAEYWSVDDQFESLSIGYAIQAKMSYSITAVATNYTYTMDSSEVAREYQPIKSFEHSSDNYDAEARAYVINDDFPVSYTLATSGIGNSDTYNEELINSVFPESAIAAFYDGFFETLDYDLMKNLVVTTHAIVDEETFESHWNTETIEDPAGGDPIEVKTMKEESVPTLKSYTKQIPLSDIVYNANKFIYEIAYTKSYELNTRFRIVNGTGIENFSEVKTITVN
ncbi:hypothetical protein [Maribellus sediminis]|uniref:hypothetical protein n=1 Tax=Maribellus sediminis TaxID=2696285 RepID=UPI00142F5C5C|nr:hypothetical protein [Maribellus sediminis]